MCAFCSFLCFLILPNSLSPHTALSVTCPRRLQWSSSPPTAAGHHADRTGSCGTRGQRLPLLYLQSQELKAVSGTQTSECDSIHQRQRLLLQTNRAAKINDEFWTPIVGQYHTSFSFFFFFFTTDCIVSQSAGVTSLCCFWGWMLSGGSWHEGQLLKTAVKSSHNSFFTLFFYSTLILISWTPISFLPPLASDDEFNIK